MFLVLVPMVTFAGAANEFLPNNIAIGDVGDGSNSVTALALLTDVATSAGVAGAEATLLVARGEDTTLADADLASKTIYESTVTTDGWGLAFFPTFGVTQSGYYSIFFGGTGVATPTKIVCYLNVQIIIDPDPNPFGSGRHEVFYGDIDLSSASYVGDINTNDLTVLTRYIVGNITILENDSLLAANLDSIEGASNYEINTNDLTVLTKYLAGIITAFPSGSEVIENTYILDEYGTKIAERHFWGV